MGVYVKHGENGFEKDVSYENLLPKKEKKNGNI